MRFLLFLLSALVLLASPAFGQATAGAWLSQVSVAGTASPCPVQITPGVTCYLTFGTGTYSATSGVSQRFSVQSSTGAALCLDGDIAATTAGGTVDAIYKAASASTLNGAPAIFDSSGQVVLPSASGETCFTLVRGVYMVSYTTFGALQSVLTIEGL